MKLFFIIIVFLFQMSDVYSQSSCDSDLICSQAEIFYRQRTELFKAVELYKVAFSKKIPDGSKVLDALEVATLINDTLSVIHFLGNCLAIGISTVSLQKFWPRMGHGMDFEYHISRIDTIAMITQHNASIDTKITNKLKLMAENDQKYRGEEELDYISQKNLDSINWVELKQMVQNLGRLPHFIEIGLEGQENMEILFYHMDKGAIEWFLPFVRQSVAENSSRLGSIVLYQLDRIGMSEGVLYTITENNRIEIISNRTKMKNGFFCQSFGEWFDEKSFVDHNIYETPIDPQIEIDEVNRVRGMFCLDSIDSKRKRKPWVNIISIEEFERLVY